MSLFSTPELESRFVQAIEKIAENSDRRGQGRGPPKPVECFVCKDRGKIVLINLKRKAKPVEGQSPFDLFDMDGKVHQHIPMPGDAKPTGTPPGQPSKPDQAKTPTAAANTDQIMNYLKGVWPIPGGPAVTDCGDHWRITSPYLEDRDQWKELAASIRRELGGEYVSDKENREFYFMVRKPKP